MSEASLDFAGKRALVTGGSRGVGRAVCLELARRGADIAFLYRQSEVEAAATAAQIGAVGRRALALKADLAEAGKVGEAVERAAAELGRIDVVVHAAGAMVTWREVAEIEPAGWDAYLAVDLSGPFYLLRAALPHLRRAGGGAIVAISSIAAQMCQARNAQGAAAKAGLEALIRVVAREEGKRGIRGQRGRDRPHRHRYGPRRPRRMGEEATQRVIRSIPLRRIGTPQEVARVVAFLAGPDGAYITGKVLQVDGGQIIAG